MNTTFITMRLRHLAMMVMLALPLCLSANTVNCDVNNDGEITIADVNEVIDAILTSSHNMSADVNNDGEVTIADVNEVIDVILNGIDPYLEVCKKVSAVDKNIVDYYEQCEQLDELVEHIDDIMAIDGVVDVYTDERTTLFVVIQDFGTLTYSYYPSVHGEFSSEIHKKQINQNQNRKNLPENRDSYSSLDKEGLKVLIVNQQSQEEDRTFQTDTLIPTLQDCFLKAGFDCPRIENSPDPEFFRTGIFDCDYLLIFTHGHFDKKTNTHWMATSELVPRDNSGNIIPEFLLKYKNYNDKQIRFDYYAGGRNVVLVSDQFIATSTSQFNHPGKAIVFNTACQSMKGPGKNAPDSISYYLPLPFMDRGAGAYLGYDETNSMGTPGQYEFWAKLLSGMSLKSAYDDLSFVVRHEHVTEKAHWYSFPNRFWADLVLYAPSLKQTCINRPEITFIDHSDDNCLHVDLEANIYYEDCSTSYYDEESETGFNISFSEFSDIELRYGFELSESEQFSDLISSYEKKYGDDGFNWTGKTSILSFSQSLTNEQSQLKPGTKYWARAFVYDGNGYNYSNPISFTTADIETPDVPAEAIDLGLPSGTKWAAYNVGATKPEEYGGYYSWGETETKETYYWEDYIHCDGTKETCHDIGEDITGTEYDVAHVKWGGEWQLPTSAQMKELVNTCTKKATTRNGTKGFELTGPNGNTIFFPATGYATGNQILYPEIYCIYNSGSLYPGDLQQSMCLIIDDSSFSVCGIWNSLGHSVRPVINAHHVEPPTEVIPVGNTGLSIKMIGVQGGTFTMGATPEQGDDVENWEKPAHKVTLSSYKIAEIEVTQALWVAVMGSNPSTFKGDLNRPVETINWDDSQQFITKLNSMTGRHFRLPTEAEWEFAARGGNKTNHYKYSGSNIVNEVAWHPGNSGDITHPVAQKKPNELGLYDMSGNVWEFCQDWYSYYSSADQFNPTGAVDGSTNPYRIIRGGSWLYQVDACRVANRNICSPSTTYRNNSSGFRLAMDADD